MTMNQSILSLSSRSLNRVFKRYRLFSAVIR